MKRRHGNLHVRMGISLCYLAARRLTSFINSDEEPLLGVHSDVAVKWNMKAALLPPAPGNEPIDPGVSPRVYKSLFTRKVANVPEQGEYPALGNVDRYLGYHHPKSATKKGDMDNIVQEYFTKIVKGDLQVAAGVKAFNASWLAAGGTIYQQEATDQYNTWIKSHPEWKDPKATFAPEFWNTQASYPPRKKS